MSTRRLSPFGAATRGALAGAVGTLAMDLVWYARYRQAGGEDGFVDWEFSSSLKEWDDAPAPALVGKRVAEGIFQRELPAKAAALTNTAVHWGTGLLWGTLYGVAIGSLRSPSPRYGLVLGPLAWTTSYALLPLAKLYQPMWEYDARTLGRDLSAHTLFGMGTATAFRALLAHR